jgi:PPP family 3-phenylpropionic acid transporter
MGSKGPLAAFWFLYLGGLGIFFPFFSLYLRENAGLSGTQVGLVIAMIPAVGIVAQPLWGHLADRRGARARVLALLALGAAAGHGVLYRAQGFPALLLSTVFLASFATAVIPQTVAVSLAALRDPSARAFGRVRVWGTVGFLILVVGFPRLLDWLQTTRGWSAAPGVSEPGLGLLFPLTALLCLAAAAVGLTIPRGGEEALRSQRGDWRSLLRHRPVVVLLGLSVLAYLALQGPMGLFPLLIRSQGGNMETVGNLWVLMLALEIPLVLYTGASLKRLGPRGLLFMGIAAGGVRWTVCGFAESNAAIYAVQPLHGVTVAGLVIGAPLYLEAAVPERLRSTAQGLLAMVGVGLGGIASNVTAGWLLEHVGPRAPYIAGGLTGFACAALLPLVLPRAERPKAAG